MHIQFVRSQNNLAAIIDILPPIPGCVCPQILKRKLKSMCEWCFIISAISVNEPSVVVWCCSWCKVQPPSVPQTAAATLRVVATSCCVHMFTSHCSLPAHRQWDWTDPGNPGVHPTLGRVNGSGQEGPAPCLAEVHYGQHRSCELWLQFQMFSQLLLTSYEFQWLWAAVWVISD